MEGAVLVGRKHQAFEKYGVIMNYKENRIGHLLISDTDNLEEDTEEQWGIDQQAFENQVWKLEGLLDSF